MRSTSTRSSLYAAKQRGGWLKQAAIELGLSEDVLRSDLGKLLRVVEQRQDQLIRAKLKPKAAEEAAPALPPEQHEAALALLKSPDLIERIVADVEATGVVGEASNALVAYLACVSRKARQAAGDPDPVDQRGRQIDADGCGAGADAGS